MILCNLRFETTCFTGVSNCCIVAPACAQQRVQKCDEQNPSSTVRLITLLDCMACTALSAFSFYADFVEHVYYIILMVFSIDQWSSPLRTYN